jgi:hypothetical protein
VNKGKGLLSLGQKQAQRPLEGVFG